MTRMTAKTFATLCPQLAELSGRRPYHKDWRYAFRLRDLRAAFATDYEPWDLKPFMVANPDATPEPDMAEGRERHDTDAHDA